MYNDSKVFFLLNIILYFLRPVNGVLYKHANRKLTVLFITVILAILCFPNSIE